MTGLGTFPVHVIVRGRRALVLGATGECVPKIQRLVDAGARVRVVTANGTVDAAVRALDEERRIELFDRSFQLADAEDAALVIVGTEHEEIGAALAKAAESQGQLVATIDRPEASTFIHPAVATGSGISIAVSSDGRAPALVKTLRVAFEEMLGNATFAAFVNEVSARRAATPRGDRPTATKALLDGLRLQLRVAYPTWFREPPLVPSGG